MLQRFGGVQSGAWAVYAVALTCRRRESKQHSGVVGKRGTKAALSAKPLMEALPASALIGRIMTHFASKLNLLYSFYHAISFGHPSMPMLLFDPGSARSFTKERTGDATVEL